MCKSQYFVNLYDSLYLILYNDTIWPYYKVSLQPCPLQISTATPKNHRLLSKKWRAEQLSRGPASESRATLTHRPAAKNKKLAVAITCGKCDSSDTMVTVCYCTSFESTAKLQLLAGSNAVLANGQGQWSDRAVFPTASF